MSAGIRLAGFRLHLERAAVQLRESGDAVIERQVNAMPCQMALDEVGDLPVERGQHLIEHLDERHVEAEMDQVLRHLETDESAADHHRTAHGLHHLDSRIVDTSRSGTSCLRSTHSRIVLASGTVLT